MKNKKGIVIGKSIATITSLISILILMIAFMVAASIISAFKSPTSEEASVNVFPQNNLLLQTISLTLDDETRDVLVFDAISLKLQGELLEDEINTKLKSLLNEQNDCYLLIDTLFAEGVPGAATTDWGFQYLKEGSLKGTFYSINDYKKYEAKNLLHITTFKTPNIERSYKHYFGPCLGGQNE